MLKRTLNTSKKTINTRKHFSRPVIRAKKNFAHSSASALLLNAVEDGEIDAMEALDACMGEMFEDDIQRIYDDLCCSAPMFSRNMALKHRMALNAAKKARFARLSGIHDKKASVHRFSARHVER